MTAQPFAVYGYRDAAGRFLYIGQTADLSTRRASHEATAPWFNDALSFEVLSTHATRRAALAAEMRLIEAENPPHNVFHSTRSRSACASCGRQLVVRRDGMLPLHRERLGLPCDGGHRPSALVMA